MPEQSHEPEPVDYRDALDEVETLRQELARSEAVCATAMAEVEALKADLAKAGREAETLKAELTRIYALLQTARDAARRLSAVLVANAGRLDVPFTNHPGSPWTLHVLPAINRLRQGLGMCGAWPVGCTCKLHGRTCEPPSELCCDDCSESQHPNHVDGSACSAPDLSGYQMPTETELALRTEVIRLTDDQAAMRRVVEAAKAWRAMRSGTPTTPKPESAALIAAVDALSTKDGA